MTEPNLGDCEVVRMKLSDLKKAEYNPRSITLDAIKGLANSLDRFGLMVPIVWNKKTGNIVGGHQRYDCLVEMGETETDVLVVDLDGNEEVALNITLNNPHIRGRFTNDVLKLLKECEARIGSAFNDIRLNNLFHSLDFKTDEPPTPPRRKTDGPDGGDDTPPMPPSPAPKGTGETNAVVTCPACASKWRLKDNKVIVDNSGEQQ